MRSSKCDLCKAAPATVHLTQSSGSETKRRDLCEKCARKHGVDDPTGFALADLLLGGAAAFTGSNRTTLPSVAPAPAADAPERVAQRQLDAYNAKDINAFLETYAPDAYQFEHPDTLLARGRDEIKRRLEARFQEPDLHARLLKAIVLGHYVIDHEEVTRSFPERKGKGALVAIYPNPPGKIRGLGYYSTEKLVSPAYRWGGRPPVSPQVMVLLKDRQFQAKTVCSGLITGGP